MMAKFQEIFGRLPEVRSEAHGRVNLIGEHTDYNLGFVLPIQIPQSTRVELASRAGSVVRLFSENYGMAEFELEQEHPSGRWIDYIQGITRELRTRGHKITGFEGSIESEIPSGSGLSSSAALEISFLRALRQLFQLSLDDVELALVGHRAEHDFVGARVGLMDQMVVSLGSTLDAFFLDTKTLHHNAVPLPDRLDIVVINSGITHKNREGNYNIRRSECEKACELLNISSLRELSQEDFERVESLPQPYAKRVRHVITENDRVLRTIAAMENDDVETVGRLLNESHASMRDDYEVSVPQIDDLVRMAQQEPAAFGARMTGGGFGGAILIAVEKGSGKPTADHVIHRFYEATNVTAFPLVVASG